MRFQKGQVANPKGRPKGSRNKRTLFDPKGFNWIEEWLENYWKLDNPKDKLSALMAVAPYRFSKPNPGKTVRDFPTLEDEISQSSMDKKKISEYFREMKNYIKS